VYSPSDCFALKPGVRLRPVPEMGVCLAYTRNPPGLHSLNAASWLIACLCDGRSLGDIAAAYRSALGGKPGSQTTLEQGVQQLLALGILRSLPPRSAAEVPAQALSREGGNL
jgi:hypothetical protein